MEETVKEETDDEPLDDLAHLLQEEPEEETPTKKLSTTDHTTHLGVLLGVLLSKENLLGKRFETDCGVFEINVCGTDRCSCCERNQWELETGVVQTTTCKSTGR